MGMVEGSLYYIKHFLKNELHVSCLMCVCIVFDWSTARCVACPDQQDLSCQVVSNKFITLSKYKRLNVF